MFAKSLSPTRILKAAASVRRGRLTLLLPLGLVRHSGTPCIRALKVCRDSPNKARLAHYSIDRTELVGWWHRLEYRLITGSNTGLPTANSGADLLQIAAILGGSQHQSGTFQPDQLLQVEAGTCTSACRRTGCCESSCIGEKIEAAAPKKAKELVKAEKAKSEKVTLAKATNVKPLDDDSHDTLRGSAGGRSQGARKRKTTAEANAGNAQTERERDEPRESLMILEDRLGSGTRSYDTEAGTRPSRVKKTTATRCFAPCL